MDLTKLSPMDKEVQKSMKRPNVHCSTIYNNQVMEAT